MAKGFYVASAASQNISTGITILEITAPSTAILKIIRAWVSNVSSTTSAVARIQLLRKTGTITGTATPPSAISLGAEATSGVTVKWKATAEGTDGNVLIEDGFNVLNNWLYLPVPEERVTVPPSGIIALKFPAAPPNINYSYGIEWEEIG